MNTASNMMKQATITLFALALLLGSLTTQAQDKKAAATEAKAQVAADKADLKLNKAARKADKMSGDQQALKADRKARMHKEGKLVKDEAKKDVKVVKQKL
jgi:hypothetical protein